MMPTSKFEIEFRNEGIYQYFEVPHDEYEALMKAAAIGRYYSRFIKPVYLRFRKMK